MCESKALYSSTVCNPLFRIWGHILSLQFYSFIFSLITQYINKHSHPWWSLGSTQIHTLHPFNAIKHCNTVRLVSYWSRSLFVQVGPDGALQRLSAHRQQLGHWKHVSLQIYTQCSLYPESNSFVFVFCCVFSF